METARDLIKAIKADISAGLVTAAEVAEVANIPATSLYSMLGKKWNSRAVDNVDAIRLAYRRMGKEISRRRKAKVKAKQA